MNVISKKSFNKFETVEDCRAWRDMIWDRWYKLIGPELTVDNTEIAILTPDGYTVTNLREFYNLVKWVTDLCPTCYVTERYTKEAVALNCMLSNARPLSDFTEPLEVEDFVPRVVDIKTLNDYLQWGLVV